MQTSHTLQYVITQHGVGPLSYHNGMIFQSSPQAITVLKPRKLRGRSTKVVTPKQSQRKLLGASYYGIIKEFP
jgi:hypothetical protein